MRQLFLPPHMFLLSGLAMIVLDQTLPLADLRGIPVHWSGLVLVLGGIAIAVKHAQIFARVETEINTFRNPQKLVQEGLFKYSRNPMYLGFVLSLAGLAIFLGCASAIIPLLVFFALTNFWYIPFEERNLQHAFGEQYASYRNSVRRWL